MNNPQETLPTDECAYASSLKGKPMIEFTCKGCDRPIFYDWVTHGGDENDEHRYHVGCYYYAMREKDHARKDCVGADSNHGLVGES